MAESEDDADEVIEDLERLIEQAASHRKQTPKDELHPVARDHIEAIRRQSSRSGTQSER